MLFVLLRDLVNDCESVPLVEPDCRVLSCLELIVNSRDGSDCMDGCRGEFGDET